MRNARQGMQDGKPKTRDDNKERDAREENGRLFLNIEKQRNEK